MLLVENSKSAFADSPIRPLLLKKKLLSRTYFGAKPVAAATNARPVESGGPVRLFEEERSNWRSLLLSDRPAERPDAGDSLGRVAARVFRGALLEPRTRSGKRGVDDAHDRPGGNFLQRWPNWRLRSVRCRSSLSQESRGTDVHRSGYRKRKSWRRRWSRRCAGACLA